MNNHPLVTIGIPTRNRVGYLKEALESALAQTYPNIEIVVSDNASNDDTQTYLASIIDSRVKVFRQENMLEMVDNWNFCLENTKGEYFLLLSDDDLLEAFAIDSFVKGFDLDTAFVFSAVKMVDSDGSILEVLRQLPRKNLSITEVASNRVIQYLLRYFAIYPCSIMYRVSDISVLKYQKKFELAADTGMWLSVINEYKQSIFINKVLSYYRIHANSTTSNSQSERWLNSTIQLVVFIRGLKFSRFYKILIYWCSLFYFIRAYLYFSTQGLTIYPKQMVNARKILGFFYFPIFLCAYLVCFFRK